jgi:hypothetical protein
MLLLTHKPTRGIKMKLLPLLIIAVIACTPYVWNGYKLSNCDFESNYKCEAIHGIGVVIPPAAFITVWFDDDGA